MWEAAQNEMLLDEEASPATVTDELQHLLALLKAHEDELARINKYQHLFKVCATAHLRAVQLHSPKVALGLVDLLRCLVAPVTVCMLMECICKLLGMECFPQLVPAAHCQHQYSPL